MKQVQQLRDAMTSRPERALLLLVPHYGRLPACSLAANQHSTGESSPPSGHLHRVQVANDDQPDVLH